jgi:hypothetical protein
MGQRTESPPCVRQSHLTLIPAWPCIPISGVGHPSPSYDYEKCLTGLIIHYLNLPYAHRMELGTSIYMMLMRDRKC